ncbi:MAG: hypothetical protein ACTS41_01350 [Candidatus Hodgkinia cicadicola]
MLSLPNFQTLKLTSEGSFVNYERIGTFELQWKFGQTSRGNVVKLTLKDKSLKR